MVDKKYSIVVEVGKSYYVSDDECRSWTAIPRELPELNEPVTFGIAQKANIPIIDERMKWSELNISESGIGVAISNDLSCSKVRIFLTSDAGKSWEESRITLKPISEYIKLKFFWPGRWPLKFPLEGSKIASGTIYIPFDYRTFENYYSPTHILFTSDIGQTWKYKRLVGLSSHKCMLAIGNHGQIISPKSGFYMESRDNGRTWYRREFSILRPKFYKGDQYRIQNDLLDAVEFVDSQIGYAMVIHNDSIEDISKIEILKTVDGGVQWKHQVDIENVDRKVYYEHYLKIHI